MMVSLRLSVYFGGVLLVGYAASANATATGAQAVGPLSVGWLLLMLGMAVMAASHLVPERWTEQEALAAMRRFSARRGHRVPDPRSLRDRSRSP